MMRLLQRVNWFLCSQFRLAGCPTTIPLNRHFTLGIQDKNVAVTLFIAAT
jgi:hypothetical protein